MSKLIKWLSLIGLSSFVFGVDPEQTIENEAKEFMKNLNIESAKQANYRTIASWNYESNFTDENLAKKLKANQEVAKFTKEQWKKVISFPWKNFKDPDLRRQFKFFSVLGDAALDDAQLEQLNRVTAKMEEIYSTAKICDFKNKTKCDLSLEPEITELIKVSTDPEELKHVWTEFRNASGKKCRTLFTEYVGLMNEVARLNNFSNAAEYWQYDFEDPNYENELNSLWNDIKGLYSQVHAYVRRKLRERYGEAIVSKRGPIPAHLLGNQWGQSWAALYNMSVPYPERESTDVTPNMLKQNYTPLKMFKLAEEFFTSLNLSEMPELFWKNSIIEKPTDGRELVCHASAWDFYDGKDFRIKQCTVVNEEFFETTHHEMGHIQYDLQYKVQPYIYRGGANPGFHEAIGDIMSLSVSTPKHYKKIGLLDNDGSNNEEAAINHLYKMALDKLVFLPFGYLVDQWRWDVFKGKITSDDYNCAWWRYINEYQGLQPPVDRTEEDFDPGAKYHVVSGTPYDRYFVSHILQFQFHKALCIKAGQFNPANPKSTPLHNCDIYQSTAAGNALKKMLQLGSSKPWPDALEIVTGERKMNASALLEYFEPLRVWLANDNAKHGEYVGWDAPEHKCYKSTEKRDTT